MTIDEILFLIFLIVLVVQLFFLLFIFIKWTYHKDKRSTFKQPVSIVVCGYNEEKNWQKLVDHLLQQDYPKFEIVLVNDQSTDNTKYLFKQWQNHPLIKLVDIPESIKKGLGKKFALTLGIKAAQYDYLLLTDADCYPKDNFWIQSMTQYFDKKDIVLGYGGYIKRKGLLNKLIRFDTFQVALQYMSFALIGKAYMGVGRNLAYKKSLFFENKGFASHLHLPSGDDDLFIKEVSTFNNTTISCHISAHTLSEPKTTWSSWIRQKSRHLTTASFYKTYHKFMLASWSLSQSLFWLLFILLINTQLMQYALIVFFCRLCVQLLIVFPLLKKTQEQDLVFILPFLEFLFIIFQLLFIANKIFKKNRFW